MTPIPVEILALVPLSLAAGVDLYLTLLFLGAVPTLGWWGPLPGALGDLDSLGVVVVVGAFYVLEFAAERTPAGALIWNVFHALIRPVAGGLLALLLLSGHPLAVTVPGALVAASIASMAHASATGGSFLLWLSGRARPHPLLVSIAEDVGVIGLTALTIDHAAWAMGLAVVVALAVARESGSQVRAFLFTIRLTRGALVGLMRHGHWREASEIPSWVRRALHHDPAAPGALKACPAGAMRLPRAPRFVRGWVIHRKETCLLLYRSLTETVTVELSGARAQAASETRLFRRIDLATGGSAATRLYVPLDGPPLDALNAAFGQPHGGAPTPEPRGSSPGTPSGQQNL